jgi:hypothetical protein
MRLVTARLPPGPVAQLTLESAEFAEWWMNADLGDEILDERSRLLRAYDRRQLRNPLLERMDRIRASEFPGTPTIRRQPEFLALQAVGSLLYDDYDGRTWNSEQALESALTACDAQRPTIGQQRKDVASSPMSLRRCETIRDIYGNPSQPVSFSPAWRTDTAVALARQMYDSRDFGAMPILADALQDAGCGDEQLLDHCRDPKQLHVRGCWVVDLVLGKE